MERRFGRNFGSLQAIFDFVAEYLAANGLDPACSFDVDLILEELFTNMVKYSRDGMHDIAISLERDGGMLTIQLRDFDVEPFDVTRAPAVDVTRPIEERRPGGLGLHLVRQLSESIHYDYSDRNSTITVTKRLAS